MPYVSVNIPAREAIRELDAEAEAMIERFLDRCPQFTVEDIVLCRGPLELKDGPDGTTLWQQMWVRERSEAFGDDMSIDYQVDWDGEPSFPSPSGRSEEG